MVEKTGSTPSEGGDDRPSEGEQVNDNATGAEQALSAEAETVGRSTEILKAANEIAEDLNLGDPVELANVISLIDRRRYEPGNRDPDEDGSRGWAIRRNAQSAAAAKLHAAACEVWALRAPDCLIMSAVRFKSAMSIEPYLDAVQVLAHCPPRKERVSPADAMLRGLMFPIVFLELMQTGGVVADLTQDDRHSRFSLELLVRTLDAAEWEYCKHEIVENFEAVRDNLYSQLTEDGGEFPEEDPEIEIGDDFDAEGGWLQDAKFISTGKFGV